MPGDCRCASICLLSVRKAGEGEGEANSAVVGESPKPRAIVGNREDERVTSLMTHASLPWHRRILGIKYKRHRDLAARDFLDHCSREAARLTAELVGVLRDNDADDAISDRLDAALELPLLLVCGTEPPRTLRPLFEAHCLAIAHAAGYAAIGEHIDPPHQETALKWSVPWMIAADDVGEENIGHAPSPRTASGGHVSWSPGILVGGIPSPQHELWQRYGRLHRAEAALAMLLCATHVLRPDRGVRRILWTVVDEHDGIRSMNVAGYEKVSEEEVDEWDQDIEIFDPDLLLSSTLSAPCIRDCVSAIEDVNPFWPSFSRRFQVTY